MEKSRLQIYMPTKVALIDNPTCDQFYEAIFALNGVARKIVMLDIWLDFKNDLVIDNKNVKTLTIQGGGRETDRVVVRIYSWEIMDYLDLIDVTTPSVEKILSSSVVYRVTEVPYNHTVPKTIAIEVAQQFCQNHEIPTNYKWEKTAMKLLQD